MLHSENAVDSFPRFRAVGEAAVLVEFGDTIGSAVHEQVLGLDAAIYGSPFQGFVEAVPAYTSVLVSFDPVVVGHAEVESHVRNLLMTSGGARKTGVNYEVDVCYDPAFAPDLEAIAEAAGLSCEDVIDLHLHGRYEVALYGFAPGYAYLSGVPEPIRLPRKSAAVRDVPAGSVIVAGQQCLVTTLRMPTGWWIIGRSSTPILRRDDPARPFLFDVGDTVSFRRVEKSTFESGLK